jgi:hypothetical protein
MSAIIQEISDQQEEARHDGNAVLYIIPRLSDILPGMLQLLKGYSLLPQLIIFDLFNVNICSHRYTK